VGYRRVSTEEQAESGLSLQAQSRRLRAWAEAQGYELVGIESDEEVSGMTWPEKRAGLSAALEALRQGEADGLVATKLDRLSRRVQDMLSLADAFDRNGWLLATVEESIDTTTASGRFFLTQLAGMAQWERDTIAERTQAALAQLARNGRRRSGEAPFGYRHTEAGQVVQEPTEQRTLRRMLKLREDGAGPQEIANQLNEAGRYKRNGKPWTRQAVWLLLDNYDARQEALAG
jgi:DNA invertase Pin-like site-specific DNA recombinase